MAPKAAVLPAKTDAATPIDSSAKPTESITTDNRDSSSTPTVTPTKGAGNVFARLSAGKSPNEEADGKGRLSGIKDSRKPRDIKILLLQLSEAEGSHVLGIAFMGAFLLKNLITNLTKIQQQVGSL